MQKAPIRKEIETLAGVRRTWLEWHQDDDGRHKILCVEIDFTDPEEPGFVPGLLDAIFDRVQELLPDNTNMAIGALRIVPRGR